MQMSLFIQPWFEVAIMRRKKKRGGGQLQSCAHELTHPLIPGSPKSSTFTCPFGNTNRGGTAAPSADTASSSITKTSESDHKVYL